MGQKFFLRLGRLVSEHWWQWILGWVLILGTLRLAAPAWDSVTYDGDLAYLPDRSPSVIGESLLSRAFPHDHAKSQVVLIISRPDQSLAEAEEDVFISYDVARRMKALHGAAAFHRALRLQESAAALLGEGKAAEAKATRDRAELAMEEARQAMDEAVDLDKQLMDFRRNPDGTVDQNVAHLASAYWNRSLLLRHLGETDKANVDRQRALHMDPECARQGDRVLPNEAEQLPILDVWTWRDPVYGAKLVSPDRHARLVVLQVANEFLAIRNQPLLQLVEQQLALVRQTMTEEQRSVLSVRVSGSAAVGGDMLRSAKESIDNTELYTVLLIVGILVIVYRAPLLVIITLISIVVSLVISTNLVALLAGLAELPGVERWWGFKVFTTTKIFIVVILFGAGTDYCLFLIARYREELAKGLAPAEASSRALSGVGDALAASALTTIVGLAMMFFSEFGKFRYSGPVIGLCLTVGLLVCLTLTPALLAAFGRYVFWPFSLQPAKRVSWSESFWTKTANILVRRPGLILAVSVCGMVPLATYGMQSADHVTYDVLSGLDESRPSRQGAEALRQHFPIGESGPVTVVLFKPDADFRSSDGRKAIYELAEQIYAIEGVSVVRSIVDPLGDFPPGQTIGITNRRAWMTWLSRPHRKTEALFVAQTAEFGGTITRLDVILQHDPFSREAVEALRRLDQKLHAFASNTASFWRNSQFSYAGPTAAVRDLREVTIGDRKRIELLVVLAVYAVLVAILRRPIICLYLIASVLFTYFVTIGLTELFFMHAYGSTYQGLDWKVPVFLFVILVAVGQDYNVCLVTRVFEEQERHGPMRGLREAMVRTGGIITSCGVIMAGTFVSMTSVAWEHAVPASWVWLRQWLHTGGGLRGMVELGFALTVGVLIDTFIVRPILVPAFFALIARAQRRRVKRLPTA